MYCSAVEKKERCFSRLFRFSKNMKGRGTDAVGGSGARSVPASARPPARPRRGLGAASARPPATASDNEPRRGFERRRSGRRKLERGSMRVRRGLRRVLRRGLRRGLRTASDAASDGPSDAASRTRRLTRVGRGLGRSQGLALHAGSMATGFCGMLLVQLRIAGCKIVFNGVSWPQQLSALQARNTANHVDLDVKRQTC